MILTAEVVELVDVRDGEPPNGSKVLALTHGGKLVEVLWKSRSRDEFDSWMPYPKVPDSVKKRQSDRYK